VKLNDDEMSGKVETAHKVLKDVNYLEFQEGVNI